MNQQRSLEEISDGKIYDVEDIVNADAKGCEGCNACCQQIGDLVMLTPFDMHELVKATGQSFAQLMEDKITLREEKKVLLPYLKMSEGTQNCSFLNEQGRCSIHEHRPNICRLFPLGRVYQGNDFKYFLQINNCRKKVLGAVKVSEWINIRDYEKNKELILSWHQLVKALQFRMKFVYDEEMIKSFNNLLHDYFYMDVFETDDAFYEMYFKRLPDAKKELGIL